LQALGIQEEEAHHKLSQVIQATEDRLKIIEKQQPQIVVQQLSHAPMNNIWPKRLIKL
jgi:hypothetical protein